MNPQVHLEDYAGYYATEFSTSDSRVEIVCTRDFNDFRKISIVPEKGAKDRKLKVETLWVTLRFMNYDGHLCLGELEVVEQEDGIIYIDADFGAFRIHSRNSVPRPKNA